MNNLRWLGLLLTIMFFGYPSFADEISKNLQIAKVGDWVEMQIDIVNQGKATSCRVKTLLKNRDKDFITLQTFQSVNGKATLSNEQKIPLLSSNPLVQGSGTAPIAETLGSGDEMLVVSGKTFQCRWVKKKVEISRGGKKTVITSTAWTSPDFPMSPLVKRTVIKEGGTNSQTTEVAVGFGSEQ